MIPHAFLARMREMKNLDFDAFSRALEEPPVRALRINRKKADIAHVRAILPFQTIPIPFCDEGFLANADKVGMLPSHHAGMFYMQDPSAISAVAAAEPQPGARVIDLCAAPGGKSTQLAAAIGNEGVLVANEYVTSRCRILQGNIERMGLQNTVVTNLDTKELADFYGACFDLVVADAPCSGEGMFRKYEVAGEEWSEENVRACARRQREILQNAARLVADGGRLLYSTCTFSLEENEENVDAFLEEHPEFHLIPVAPAVAAVTADGIPFEGSRHGEALTLCRRFYPHLFCGEGQFLALFQKSESKDVIFDTDAKNTEIQNRKNARKSGKFSKELGNSKDVCAEQPLTAAEQRTVSELLKDILEEMPTGRLVTLRDAVSLVPPIALPPRGVFAAGVTIGTWQKGRLLPHHHLFSALGAQFKSKLCLSDGDLRVAAYLAGEELEAPELSSFSGYTAVLYENAPLGGGKAVNGRLKNHYPKGLRSRG